MGLRFHILLSRLNNHEPNTPKVFTREKIMAKTVACISIQIGEQRMTQCHMTKAQLNYGHAKSKNEIETLPKRA